MLLIGLLLAIGCSRGDADADLSKTPLTELDIAHLLERASNELAEADSVRAKVNINVGASSRPEIFVTADASYVAPSSLFGLVEIPDGVADFSIHGDRIYMHGDGDWVWLEDTLGYSDQQEYQGGLIDLQQLRDEIARPRVTRHTTSDVEFTAGMGSAGLNSYLVRVIEYMTVGGPTAFLVREVRIHIDAESGRFKEIVFSGTNSAEFSIGIEFSHYNDVDGAPTEPVEATPYVFGYSELLTPTPVVPVGCARNIEVLDVDARLGHTFGAGEQIEAIVSYSAPGCQNVMAEFIGEYGPDSPRYKRICRRQCDDAINGLFISDPIALPEPHGRVTVQALTDRADIYQPAEERIVGFKLCQVNLTFTDGALGGTFYRYSVDQEC